MRYSKTNYPVGATWRAEGVRCSATICRTHSGLAFRLGFQPAFFLDLPIIPPQRKHLGTILVSLAQFNQ